MKSGGFQTKAGLLKTTALRIDEQRWPQPPDYLFDAARWPGGASPVAAGRGAAWFVADRTGRYVLRRFRRGGLIGRLVEDRYVATGAGASRAFREYAVLRRLVDAGLPVPRPAAAAYWRRGLVYRAALLTERIDGVRSLAERLADAPLERRVWSELGALLARFHREGLWHADLNAHNVLLNDAGRMFLIDFDRARFRPPGRWRHANLARLRRSLTKLAATDGLAWGDADWAALEAGYSGASSDARSP